MKMKEFRNLGIDKQNKIRKEYKNIYSKEYKYSVYLYIGEVICGLFVLGGLFLAIVDLVCGLLLSTISFIGMIIFLYFLDLSNNYFLRFLKRKGFEYEDKM